MDIYGWLKLWVRLGTLKVSRELHSEFLGDAVIAEISMMSSEWRIVQFEYSDHHKSKSGIPFFSQQPNKHQKFVFGV